MFDTFLESLGENRIAHRDGCMCEACCRAAEDQQTANATITEFSDAPANVFTPYSMSVGDTFNGTATGVVPQAGVWDEDWVAISLVQGQTYTMDLFGRGSAPVTDTFLWLRDSNGNLITADDDDGPGLDAQITYTATYSGTYYVVADGYGNGAYSLTVNESGGGTGGGGGGGGTLTDGSLDELAFYLTDGFWSRAYFDPITVGSTITVNITGLTAEGQQLARWAFEAWEMVANLTFIETTSNNANIMFQDNQSGAFAGPDNIIGQTYTQATVNVEANWINLFGSSIDSYTFGTYIHEIGHALGLGHMGPYNGGASFPSDAVFANDSYQISVMSYFSQTDNPNVIATYGDPISAMMADIVAIQDLYGGPSTTSSPTAGNTVWGEGGNTGTYVDDIFALNSPNMVGNAIAGTIFDVGGVDTLNLRSYNSSQMVDLNEETFSNINGNIGNLGIARDTVIENLILGAGTDTVVGNDAANAIEVYGGNDVVDSGGGNDRIFGGFGFDTLSGGAGNDELLGEENADYLYGDGGNDTLRGDVGTDNMWGGTGNDLILGGTEADRLYGEDGNDILFAGSNFSITVDGLFGGAGNDSLYGEAGFDYLEGNEGDDFLDGGHQADNLFGNEGNDTLVGDLGFDRLFGGAGNDSLDAGDGSDALFGDFGNDTLFGGLDDDRFWGGDGNDLLFGGSGNDFVRGNAGFDTLDGGTGDDELLGLFNADIFVFGDGHGNDTIADFDALNGFEKIDLSAVSTINSLADLNLSSASSGAAVQSGANVVITTSAGNTITLVNVNISNLDQSDFLF